MKATERKTDIRELCELSVLCALMVGGKEAMNVLPNIHPVMLLIILCVRVYGKKGILPAVGFSLIEILLYGLSMWNIPYLYVWIIFALLALPFRSNESSLFWAVFSAIAGLLFGPLSAAAVIPISGFKTAVGYWVSGIGFDLIHCASNFILTLILIKPLYELVMKLKSR